MARRAFLPPEIEAVAAMGWCLYPSVVGSKAACFQGASDAATCDLDILRDWQREYHEPNWRLVFGPSNLIGLDLDVPPGHAHDGVAGLAALASRHGGIPRRPTARSGGGGLGLFWTAPAVPIRGDAGHPAPGCDPRRGRQSQTIPPSTHWRTGAPYRWIIPPWDCPPPECPPWLVNLIREAPPPPPPRYAVNLSSDRASKALNDAVAIIQYAGPGGRNTALNKAAYRMGRWIAAGLIGEGEVELYLTSAGLSIGLDRLETKATIRSGIRSGFRKGPPDAR